MFLPHGDLQTPFPTAHKTQWHILSWCRAGKKTQKGERKHLFQEAAYNIIMELTMCWGEKSVTCTNLRKLHPGGGGGGQEKKRDSTSRMFRKEQNCRAAPMLSPNNNNQKVLFGENESKCPYLDQSKYCIHKSRKIPCIKAMYL